MSDNTEELVLVSINQLIKVIRGLVLEYDFKKYRYYQTYLIPNDGTVIELDQFKNFVYQPQVIENWLTALIQITILVDHSLKKLSALPIDQLINIKNRLIFDKKLGKSSLNSYPLILQPLFLLSDLRDDDIKKVTWLNISIYTFIVLKHHKKPKTHLKNSINRFKLPVFYKSKNNQWIWKILPRLDIIDHPINEPDYLYVFFTGQVNILEDERRRREEVLNNSVESKETIKFRDKKINQLKSIARCFEHAYYPYKKNRRNRNKKKYEVGAEEPFESLFEKKIDKFKEGAIWIDHSYWNRDKYDIEAFNPRLYYQYPNPPDFIYNTYLPNSSKPKNIEEYVDTFERPLIIYKDLPDKTIRYIQPLQRLERNVQHSYISQSELELNSNVRTLSVAGLKQVFSRLAVDSHQPTSDFNKASALLLLSMMTALPIEHLLTPAFITQSGLFVSLKDKIYLQYQLNITEHKLDFDPNIHENKAHIIRLPLPTKLVSFLSRNSNLPTKDNILDYITPLSTL